MVHSPLQNKITCILTKELYKSIKLKSLSAKHDSGKKTNNSIHPHPQDPKKIKTSHAYQNAMIHCNAKFK